MSKVAIGPFQVGRRLELGRSRQVGTDFSERKKEKICALKFSHYLAGVVKLGSRCGEFHCTKVPDGGCTHLKS